MSRPNVLAFSEDVGKMTFAEGLAFIERTRRQLCRFGIALPGANGRRLHPEAEAEILHLLDELEADIHRLLADI